MFAADRASWQNPKVLTTLLLVFLAGAFAGALSMRYGLHRTIHAATLSLRPDGRDAFLGRCQKELNLSADQAKQITLVLDDYKSYYDNLQDQLQEIRAT